MRMNRQLANARGRFASVGTALAIVVAGGLGVTVVAQAPTPAPPTPQPPPATQTPTPPAGQQPAQQAPATRVFNSGAGMILNQVKPDKTADFEMVMGRVKEALLKSEDPVRKQQAASWKMYKSPDPNPNGSVLYIFVLDPAVKDADYTIGKILFEAFPTEVQALYKTFSESYAGGQTPINVQLVLDMGK